MDSREEFGMKMDRLKKLVAEKDYATALKIVEGIDWNRVKSSNLLVLASSVYEENGMLEEARDVLTIALDRSGAGKRILYKMTELAVRSGDVEDALDYYQEYTAVAPEDPGCLILQYMILKVQHAPYSQLIKCLELYNEYEPDEKWMYELATTYESAGRVQDAVALCDRIALMFGNSVYALKALKLKQKYTRLTDEQRSVLHPSSLPAAGVRNAVEEQEIVVTKTTREPEVREERLGDRLAANVIENEDELFEAYLKEHDPLRGQNVPEEPAVVPEEVLREAEGPVAVERTYEPEEEPEEVCEEPEPEREAVPVVSVEIPGEKDPDAELLRADARIAEAKLANAEEGNGPEEQPVPKPQARVAFTGTKTEPPAEAEETVPEKTCPGIHLIIEAIEEEEGVSIARKELGLIYGIRGEKSNVAKAAAEKLNRLGDMKTMTAKIGSRDLVIVQAGDLEEDIAAQLLDMLDEGNPDRSIIFVDTPEGLDMLEDRCPELFDACDILTDLDAREKDYSVPGQEKPEETGRPETEGEAPGEEPEETDGNDGAEESGEPVRRHRKNDLLGKSGNVPFKMPVSDNEIMEFEDFAQYCIYYANDKGCAISGKTLLALYEKIEIMEEDGIALTKLAAEDCVEEAADHAENPGLKGLFRKKYDNEDLLILREEDFIN